MFFNQSLTPFTEEGRVQITTRLRIDIRQEIVLLLESKIPKRRVEYLDNSININITVLKYSIFILIRVIVKYTCHNIGLHIDNAKQMSSCTYGKLLWFDSILKV